MNLENLKTKALAILQINNKKKLKKIAKLQEKRDYELFDYVYSLIQNLEIFSIEHAPIREKSNEVSETLRKEGNELLNSPEFKLRDALKKFSSSITFAELDSEQLSLAHSDRSHLFFEQRFYNECVRDIQRALNCNPSDDLKQKLELRREQVEEFREHHKTLDYHDEVPRLPGSKNKRIRCASRAIGFETNEKWGQHIEARRDISIGEVIVVERPYISRIHLNEWFFHCHECLELCYDLIPCPNCTLVMYCTDVCRLKAFQEYHKYECILLQRGLRVHNSFLIIALKAVINYSIFLEDLSIDDAPFETVRSNRYKDVSTMKTFKEHMTPEQLFSAVLEPILVYHFLTKYTSILNDLDCGDKEIVLKEILVRNSLMVINNNHPVLKSEIKQETVPSEVAVGLGIYPFYSKFHHSCFCNTGMVFYGTKMVIYAIANIKKGEHVTTNYGVSFYERTKAYRKRLLNVYHYTCECPACENDWPLKDELRQGTPLPTTLQTKVMQHISSGINDRSVGKKLLDETYQFYNRLRIMETPSRNYLLLRGYVLHLLRLTGNTTIAE